PLTPSLRQVVQVPARDRVRAELPAGWATGRLGLSSLRPCGSRAPTEDAGRAQCHAPTGHTELSEHVSSLEEAAMKSALKLRAVGRRRKARRTAFSGVLRSHPRAGR